MENKTVSGVMENAYGKPLAAPIAFEGEYTAYASFQEVVDAKDELKPEEVVKVRNEQRKAAARQKAMQAALDAAGIVKPTLENDEQLRLKKMFDVLVANGTPEATARTQAETILNLKWAE